MSAPKIAHEARRHPKEDPYPLQSCAPLTSGSSPEASDNFSFDTGYCGQARGGNGSAKARVDSRLGLEAVLDHRVSLKVAYTLGQQARAVKTCDRLATEHCTGNCVDDFWTSQETYKLGKRYETRAERMEAVPHKTLAGRACRPPAYT